MANSKISDLTEATSLADTDLFVIAQEDTANKKITAANMKVALTAFTSYAILSDVQDDGATGGTITSGSWQTRVLNTEVDPDGIVTLASNQFDLVAGTYLVIARASSFACDHNRIRIQNVDDTTTAAHGTGEFANSATAATVNAWAEGRFTIAATKTFELQHRCSSTRSTDGLGVSQDWGGSVIFATVWIYKE